MCPVRLHTWQFGSGLFELMALLTCTTSHCTALGLCLHALWCTVCCTAMYQPTLWSWSGSVFKHKLRHRHQKTAKWQTREGQPTRGWWQHLNDTCNTPFPPIYYITAIKISHSLQLQDRVKGALLLDWPQYLTLPNLFKQTNKNATSWTRLFVHPIFSEGSPPPPPPFNLLGFCCCFSVQTPFKGYCLATGCKKTKHTRSGSSKRVCCFLLQLDLFFPFHRHTFIISLYLYVCVHSINCVNAYTLGSGDNSVLEQQTQDQKVLGLSPGRSGRRIFFSRVNFLC